VEWGVLAGVEKMVWSGYGLVLGPLAGWETGLSSSSSQCHAAAAAADTSTPFATPSSQDNKKAMKQEAQVTCV